MIPEHALQDVYRTQPMILSYSCHSLYKFRRRLGATLTRAGYRVSTNASSANAWHRGSEWSVAVAPGTRTNVFAQMVRTPPDTFLCGAAKHTVAGVSRQLISPSGVGWSIVATVAARVALLRGCGGVLMAWTERPHINFRFPYQAQAVGSVASLCGFFG